VTNSIYAGLHPDAQLSSAAEVDAAMHDSLPAPEAANEISNSGAALKRTSEEAGPDSPQPQAGSRAVAANGKHEAMPSSFDASAGKSQEGDQDAALDASGLPEPVAGSEAGQQTEAAGAVDVAVGKLAHRLRRNASRVAEAEQLARAHGEVQDVGAPMPPPGSSASPSAAASEVDKGAGSADGSPHASSSTLADSAAASLAEGACQAAPPSTSHPSAGVHGRNALYLRAESLMCTSDGCWCPR